jgi:hypothetical protein
MSIHPFIYLVLILTPILCRADYKSSCSDQWYLCPTNFYGCDCTTPRDTSINCICNQPSYYGCSCIWQCSSNCGTKQIGVVSVLDCVDGPFGDGQCLSCSAPSDQFGANCDTCDKVTVGVTFQTQVSTAVNIFSIDYPDVTGGALEIWYAQFPNTLYHQYGILEVRNAAGFRIVGAFEAKFCEIEFKGTTCSGLNQADVCRCIDPQYVFRLPAPLVMNTFDDGSRELIPWWFQFDSLGRPRSFPYDITRYCCLPSCPDGHTGCRCEITCGTACKTCSSAIDISDIECTQCQASYYLLDPPLEDPNVIGKIYCAACASSCSVCSGSNNTDTCKPYACTRPDRCANECLNGYWGPVCNNTCPLVCPKGSRCSQGRNGTGLCVCDDPTKVISTALFSCITPLCGADRVNLCSNHGLCVQDIGDDVSVAIEAAEYCICDAGFTGSLCSQVNTKYDECDCGVFWSSGFQSSLTALPKMRLVSDLDGVVLFGSQSPTAGIPVGNLDQAKSLCYLDFQCDGFIIWSSPFYGSQTQQPTLFPQPVTLAAYFSLDNTATTSPASLPVGITFTVYTIDRIQQNNCSSPALDINYFYVQNTTNQLIVNQYCYDNQPANGGFAVQPCYTNYWVQRYFRYEAHKHRQMNPNALCDLQPYVYSPESYCHTARCLSISGTGPPCVMDGQRTGYCSAGSTGYQCKCLSFFEANSVGTGSLNYQPFFMGLACQFPVVAFCVNGADLVLCNGVVGACQPVKQWNGEFYLQNFEGFRTLLDQDYLPRCNCNGSAFSGQYCETSRCPNDCKSLSPSAGNCVSLNPPLNTHFTCQCAQFAIGTQCEIDASVCLGANGQQCSGRGICLPANGSNHTTPYCSCYEGFFGAICEKFYCSIDQMIPGHGTCSNGIASGCYPPYSGPACAVDNCAIYGNGKVIGNPPSGCDCQYPFVNQLNGNTVASCWPQCPKSNNITCGGSVHVCVQFTDPMTDTRIAICNCASGYIRNTTTGLCDPFCVHGTVPLGWSSSNLLPCVCDIATGYDTHQGLNPRCDHPICGNNGIFNTTSLKCGCIPPFNPFTQCVTSFCSLNNPHATVIPWVEAGAGFRCACPIPTKPSNDAAPYDCNANVCTTNGIVNTAFIPNVTFARNACFCQGKYRTICANNATTCNYCASSFCLNGGSPNLLDITKCSCTYPFYGENCELNLCHPTQTLLPDSVTRSCVCKPGFIGSTCDELACLNDGVFVNNTCLCSNSILSGSRCELDVPISRVSSTGVVRVVSTPASTVNLPVIIPSVVIGSVALFGGIAVGVYVLITTTTPQIAATVAEIAPLVGSRFARRKKNY